jgi:CheY-like chemotaxis protein
VARVLIVDDDESTRDVLRESGEPIVVLLDLDLCGTDGLSVLQPAAADPALFAHRRRVIVMTAVSTVRRESARNLREALDVVLLPKPFDIDVLLAAVNGAASFSAAPCCVARLPPFRAAPRGTLGSRTYASHDTR